MVKDKASCLSQLRELDSRINQLKRELDGLTGSDVSDEKRSQLEQRFVKLERQRTRVMVHFDQNFRTYLEKLNTRYRHSSVVTILESQCPGCNVRLPTREVVQLGMPGTFSICSFCGRVILPEQRPATSKIAPRRSSELGAA